MSFYKATCQQLDSKYKRLLELESIYEEKHPKDSYVHDFYTHKSMIWSNILKAKEPTSTLQCVDMVMWSLDTNINLFERLTTSSAT